MELSWERITYLSLLKNYIHRKRVIVNAKGSLLTEKPTGGSYSKTDIRPHRQRHCQLANKLLWVEARDDGAGMFFFLSLLFVHVKVIGVIPCTL